MIVQEEIKEIQLTEVLFIFRKGRIGFDVFLKCTRELIGLQREHLREDCFYFELRNPFKRGQFFAIVSDFFDKNQFNTHLFNKSLIIETCRRMYNVTSLPSDRMAADRPRNKYYKKLQRLNYVAD